MTTTDSATGPYVGQHRHPPRHTAGAFDIRNVIAALIGFYGIVLVAMGIVGDSPRELAKTGDVNANLWAGIVMAVVAAAGRFCAKPSACWPPRWDSGRSSSRYEAKAGSSAWVCTVIRRSPRVSPACGKKTRRTASKRSVGRNWPAATRGSRSTRCPPA